MRAISTLVRDTNTVIKEHNSTVAKLDSERKTLTGQVWRYLLDEEIKTDLTAFKGKKASLIKAIESLEGKINKSKQERRDKEQEIRTLAREGYH